MIINASSSRVWEALTDPKLIKQYLFGTEVSTDWKVGSPITYRGVWNGREYEDKGRIIKAERQAPGFHFLEFPGWPGGYPRKLQDGHLRIGASGQQYKTDHHPG